MPGEGLEPTRISPADFKSAASANSATPARGIKHELGNHYNTSLRPSARLALLYFLHKNNMAKMIKLLLFLY